MDIIDQDEADDVILEGLPTPPLARDRATETGEKVQDCFGQWHAPFGPGRTGGLDFEQLVRRIVAEESEGARRERELHELEQQYDTPAYEGDNRKPRPGQQNAETVRRLDEVESEAYSAMVKLLQDGTPFGAVMDAASQVGDMDNESGMLQVAKAIAAGDADAREWFSRLADALETYLDAQRALRKADPDEIRHSGFKPKNQR